MSLRSWTRSTLDTLNHSIRSPRAHRRSDPRGAGRGAPVHPRGRLVAERLEPRLLLTTLQGGDTFEYVDASGDIVRIRLSGNIQAEIVGATVSGLTNTAEATNLPGNLNGTDIFGGLGGPGGIDIIGTLQAQVADIDINALAANASGQMFALETQTVPIPNPPPNGQQTQTLVFVDQISFPPPQPPNFPLPVPYGPRREEGVTVTRLGEISNEIVAASGGIFDHINTVPAADFNPANGLLYFVATGGVGGQNGTDTNFDKLFTVDVAGIAGSVNGIAGNFNDPGGQGGITVSDIAFDQTPAGPQLLALIGDDQGGGGGGGTGATVIAGANPFIAQVSLTNTNAFLNVLRLNLFVPGQQQGQQQVPGLSGLEVLNEDPTRVDDLLAVGGGQAYQIIRTTGSQLPFGTTLQLGALTEPVPPGGQQVQDPTGGAPSDLMFVPGMLNPFTNSLGAYVSFDQATNKLFWVNAAEQRPVTIFQVYIAHSDTTGDIAIARVPPLDQAPRDMTPFTGDVGGIRHIDAQNPATFPWPVDTFGTNAFGTSIGSVYVGARTRDLNPQDPNDDLRPILTATIPPTVDLGLLPVLQLPIDQATGRRVVGAGLTVVGDLDRFMLGGAITGDVVASGSINQFYCGWLLTGNALGDVQGSFPSRQQNFRVGGDIRDLYVLDSIGTNSDAANNAPTWLTGADITAGGTIGHIRTGDSYVGAFDVRNQPEEDATLGIDVPQSEMETRGPSAWDAFQFSGAAFFNNDTFDTPEYRGSIAGLGQKDVVDTFGTLQHDPTGAVPPNDWVDYYAVSLLAGQTVQVQLIPDLPELTVGVFDPDGRLIASDASLVAGAAGQVFSVTADRPGAYRFAVAAIGNANFVNANVVPLIASIGYELRVTDTGDLSVGGVEAANNIFDNPAFSSGSFDQERSFQVEFGDMGTFRAGAAILSIYPSTVAVLSGNLRELDGASIGFGTAAGAPDPNNPNSAGTPATLNAAVNVDVPAGSVGLVRARTGIIAFNPRSVSLGRAIGGDFQVIDGASSVFVGLNADRGLGVLRAGDMDTVPASIITVNFDNTGNDGIIDLIDCVGTFGDLGAGGPEITTNTGGNVRYIRVGGTAFVDSAFGGGTPITTQHLPGEAVTLNDDSGSRITLTPAGVPVPNPAFATNPAAPPFLFTDPNALTVRSYPIRGSGGVVIMDVTSDDSVNIDTSGGDGGTAEIGTIRIAGARAVGQGVVRDPTKSVGDFTSLLDFFVPLTNNNFGFSSQNPGTGTGLGQQDFNAPSNPLIFQPPIVAAAGGGVTTTGPVKTDLSVFVRGNVKTDVYSIIGVDSAAEGAAQFTTIENDTDGGELVNITAASVGNIISNGTIGLARSSIRGVALIPAVSVNGGSIAFPSTEYPFGNQAGPGAVGSTGAAPAPGQRSGVWIYGNIDQHHEVIPVVTSLTQLTTPLPEPGNVISIQARDGLGNIVVNGSIGEINPNKNNLHDRPGIFAGIQGPVWARGNPEAGHTAFSDEGGDLYIVNIGEGVTASGSGAISRSGIYAGRRIDTVQGNNADIRGDIIAGDAFNPLDVAATTVTVVNGQNVTTDRQISIPDSIGRIVLTNGSLINSTVMVTTRSFEARRQGFPLTNQEFTDPIKAPFFEIGRVETRGNGGVIGSFFSASDIGPITVNGGFGIFSSHVVLPGDGRFIGMEADNYGIRNVVVNGGTSYNFFNARGDGSSVSTAMFSPGVRRSEPQFGALDDQGNDPVAGGVPNILTDIHANLGTSQAQPEIPGRTDTGVIENADVRVQRDVNTIRAQQIRSTAPDLAPTIINAGNRIGNVLIRDQINGLNMTTGKVLNFKPAGDVFNLHLTVSGTLQNLLIQGSLADGSVIQTQGSSAKMGDIRINGNLNGDLLSNGGIKKLFVGQSIGGNITATGGGKKTKNAIGELIIGGALAEGGLNVQGGIGKMTVAGDFGSTGTDFTVNGPLKSMTIKGNLFANIHVASVLSKLNVAGVIASGVLVEAQEIKNVTVGGDVQQGVIFRSHKAPKIKTGGQMLGTVELT